MNTSEKGTRCDKKHYRQLCWDCQNPIGENMCSKFKNGILPSGAVLDNENYIISCPLFKANRTTNKGRVPRKPKRRKIFWSNIIPKYFKICRSTYYSNKEKWIKKYQASTGKILPPEINIIKLCEMFDINEWAYYKDQEYWEKLYLQEIEKENVK